MSSALKHGIIAIIILTFFFSCKKKTDPPVVQNSIPIVNAGLSQSTTLPADSVTLAGSATDPDGTIANYLWSQVSGPAASTIVNPGSQTTRVKGLIAGNYVFQLNATDNKGASGVDTASVQVNPAPIVTFTALPTNNPTEMVMVNHNGSSIVTTAVDLPIEAWTSGGPYTVRAILKFDLSSIYQTANIASANLYLYSYPNPTLNGNFSDANFGSTNTLLIQQVTANWTPATLTWFNQPPTTTLNQSISPHTSSSILDLNLNVTEMVRSMVNGNVNYGFLLKLQNEVAYNSRIFVSSHNTTHTTKRPKLVVVYQ